MGVNQNVTDEQLIEAFQKYVRLYSLLNFVKSVLYEQTDHFLMLAFSFLFLQYDKHPHDSGRMRVALSTIGKSRNSDKIESYLRDRTNGKEVIFKILIYQLTTIFF